MFISDWRSFFKGELQDEQKFCKKNIKSKYLKWYVKFKKVFFIFSN